MEKLTFAGGIVGLFASMLSIFSIGISFYLSSQLDELRDEFNFNTLANSCANIYGESLSLQNAIDGLVTTMIMTENALAQDEISVSAGMIFNQLQQSTEFYDIIGNFNVSYRSLLLVSEDQNLNKAAETLSDALTDFVNLAPTLRSKEDPQYQQLQERLSNAERAFAEECKSTI